jgi:ribonuclease P protein component
MLRSASDFAAVGRSDVVRSDGRLSARFVRTERDGTRFGISTSRRLGGAVVRNRIRRRIRESLRALAPRIAPGFDILLVARQGSITASQPELASTLERLLRKGGALHEERTEG